MKTRTVPIVAIVTTLACLCCVSPNAGGGTTDTGNAKVAAVIYTANGARAAHTAVTICPAGYHSGVAADSIEKRQLYVRSIVTDDTGYFEIDTIESGEYSIEINDGVANAVLLKVSISSAMDSMVALEDTLRPYAAIKGSVGNPDDSTIIRYLVTYGMERRIPVTHNGAFLLDNLPAGTYHCRVVADQTPWLPLDFDSVHVKASEMTIIAIPDTFEPADSIYRAEIVLNTALSGAGVAGDVYGFPVLLRLTGSNFSFGEAQEDGSDIRFVKQDGVPLAFAFESWDAVRYTATVWVRVDTVFGNNESQSILMLWGGTDTVPKEDGSTVFDTTDGFLASYHLDGTLNDATLHGFNGIDNGSVDAPGGIIGRARSFNGISQYFSIGDLPDRKRGTISCWFQPKATVNSSTAKTQGIWGKRDSDSLNFSLSLTGTDFYTGTTLTTNGRVVSKLEIPGSGHYVASTTGTFAAGKWYFAAWSCGDGGDSLYIDGVLEASNPKNLTLSGYANEEIGRCSYDTKNIGPYGGVLYFGGMLDEFRIDNTCRDAAWIRLCFMNQRSDDRLVNVRRVQ